MCQIKIAIVLYIISLYYVYLTENFNRSLSFCLLPPESAPNYGNKRFWL